MEREERERKQEENETEREGQRGKEESVCVYICEREKVCV